LYFTQEQEHVIFHPNNHRVVLFKKKNTGAIVETFEPWYFKELYLLLRWKMNCCSVYKWYI